MSFKLAITKFHGSPWNLITFDLSFMKFHGIFHGIRREPDVNENDEFWWNYMELGDSVFGGTRVPWNSTKYSMEFHGISLHSKFHETIIIPWNSMEYVTWVWGFHGIPWNLLMEQSSMELLKFHGFPLNLFLVVRIPWNLMKCHGMRYSILNCGLLYRN